MTKPWLKDAGRKPKAKRAKNWQILSCQASREYKQAFVKMAEELGIDQGVLVRRAIDAMYGDSINVILESNVAEEYAQTDEESDHALIA